MKIAISGKSGSGKSTVADHLLTNYGFKITSTGRKCREISSNYFGSESKSILNLLTDKMKEIDEIIWIRLALETINDNDRYVAVDGIRFPLDVIFLRGHGYKIWRIECDLNRRVERLRKRKQEFDPKVDDLHPAETALDHETFDLVVNNNHDDISELLDEIDKIMNSNNLYSTKQNIRNNIPYEF